VLGVGRGVCLLDEAVGGHELGEFVAHGVQLVVLALHNHTVIVTIRITAVPATTVLSRNVGRFRGGLVFEAQRLL